MADSVNIPIRLDDQVSGPADAAAASLQALKAKLEADSASLAKLQENISLVARSLQSGIPTDGGPGLRSLSKVAKEKKLEIEKLKAEIDRISKGGAPATGPSPLAQVAQETEQVGAATKKGLDIGQIRGFYGAIRGGEGSFRGFLSGVNKLGLAKAGAIAAVALLAIVVVKLTKAVIDAAIAFTKFAIATADAFRKQKLSLEEMGLSTRKANELADTMNRLRAATGTSVDDQVGFLKQLQDAHIEASRAAMEALAVAKAGGGDEAVKKVIEALKQGKSATQASIDAHKKFDDIVKRKMLGLDAQLDKFHEDIRGLFRDIAIEPFLKALQKLLSLFDESTATGKALHAIVTAIGNKLVSWATAAIPYIIAGIKKIVIWSLQAHIAISRFLNSSSGKVFVVILEVIGAALGVLIVTSGLVLAAMTAMFALPVAAIGLLLAGISQVIAWVGQLAVVFTGAGGSIVQGLINGVTSMGGAFIAALTNLARSGLDAVKAALGIASPSKEFAKLGMHTAAGFEEGVDGGSGGAQGALTDMVAPPAKGGSGGAKRGGNNYTITINGVQGAEQLHDAGFFDKLSAVLEGGVIELGGSLKPSET